MADTDDDDEFGSDDAFDELEPGTLIQLEQAASTQFFQQQNSRPGTGHGNAPAQRPNYAANQRRWQGQEQESWQSERTIQPTTEHVEQQEYMFDDEDVVDLDEDPYALPQQFDQRRTFVGALHTGESQNYDEGGNAQVGADITNASVAELQARILALENDRTSLQKQVDDARSAAQSKAGEAAILRGKADKAAKEYEQKVAQLRLQHAEERAKQKAELDRLASEREKLTTNNKFLEHDLAFETGKVRQLQRTATQRPPPGLAASQAARQPFQPHRPSPNVTPKKASKVLPYRDGFDDGDLVMLSPSKPKDRSKPATPSKTGAGAKRKRTAGGSEAAVVPSPPPQLQLSEPKVPSLSAQPNVDIRAPVELLNKLSLSQKKLKFMQKLQQHWVDDVKHENIFEAMTRFTLPSNPDIRLSAVLYEQLSLATSANDKTIADQFSDIILLLWAQALQESFYAPIPYFVSIMQRIFELERFVFVRKYVVRAGQLAIATADLVAIPFAQEAIKKNQAPRAGARATISLLKPPPEQLTDEERAERQRIAEAKKNIAVLPCLELLRTLANAARPDKSSINLFWQTIKFDFTLMFLMNGFPINQMMLMLQLLATSCLPETFGTISESGPGERQERREADTLDRLTALLSERFDSSREDITLSTPFEIREAVLQILHKMIFTSRGALLLAHHRHGLARLFLLLHSSLTSLPLYPHPSCRLPITSTINTSTTLIYLLTSTSGAQQLHLPAPVDIRTKLAGVQGGSHIPLLALTRVAFAERVWMERGIGIEVGEMAHEILDEMLTPEEGEGLMGMFGSDSTDGNG